MSKKNKDKNERLQFHVEKDNQNLLRLKLKELSNGVSKRYSMIPKRMWSSLVIVVGIFAIVLIALFAGGPQTQNTPQVTDQPLASLTDNIFIDEEGKLQAQVPDLPGIGLDTPDLSLESEEEEAASAARILTNPEAVENVQAEFKAIYPLRRQGAYITSYGWYLHPVLDVWRYHQGVDIRCKKGDLVMAASGGKVIDVTESDQEGIVITLDHSGGWTTVYGQVEDVKVKVGDQVGKGQEIGSIGQSASAIEPHLHFELRQNKETTDPAKYLQ